MKETVYHVKDSDFYSSVINHMNRLEKKTVNNFAYCQQVYRKFLPQALESDLHFSYALWKYVKTNFQYKPDRADEEIKAPYILEVQKTGDCDDFALYIKTVLAIFEKQSRYILLGATNKGYSHIAVLFNRIIIDPNMNSFNTINKDRYKFYKLI